MDYEELDEFLATALPTPEFNFPPFKINETLPAEGGYVIQLINSKGEIGLQVDNEESKNYHEDTKRLHQICDRWNKTATEGDAQLA